MKRSGPRKPRDNPAISRTRFAVDAMHGSLARKLRAIGFDSSYYRRGDDNGMLEIASTEGRIIVSSDRSLVARAVSKGIPAVLLKGRSDGSRLREISKGAASLGVVLKRGDSLCSLCGGELTHLKREDVSGLVPQSVERSHRLFHRCSSCGQLYWHGGHWKKLRSLARRLEES